MRVVRAVLIVTALAVPMVANAEPTLDSAKAALDASDYPGARQQLAGLLARGAHGPAELAEIYRLLGVAAGAVGDATAATEAFAHCLALAPKTTLPDGTSPKITRPFDAARAKVAKALAITAEPRTDPPAVLIRTVHDPVAMIARFRVTVRVEGAVKPAVEKPAAEELEIAVPAGGRVDVWVAAVDKHGNRLAEVGSSEVPLVIIGRPTAPGKTGDKVVKAPARPPHVEPAKPRPLYLQWWIWGGATIVAAGATTYFGMRALDGRDTLQTMTTSTPNWDTFRATMDSARRDVLITNIGFGVTGVLGLTATILFLTRPETSIAPMTVERGAGVAMGGRF